MWLCVYYKLYHTTYSDVCSLQLSACWFMNSVTLKWYAFHVYVLYLEMGNGCFYLYSVILLSVVLNLIVV
jgi:hypothetical protein